MLEEPKKKKTRNKPTKYGVDVHIRLKQETFEEIQALSMLYSMTYSQVIRKIIEDGVANF